MLYINLTIIKEVFYEKTFKIICLISILLTVFSSVCMAQDSVADQENNVLATTSSAKVEEQPISIPDTNGDVYERGSSLLLNGSINGNSFYLVQKLLFLVMLVVICLY